MNIIILLFKTHTKSLLDLDILYLQLYKLNVSMLLIYTIFFIINYNLNLFYYLLYNIMYLECTMYYISIMLFILL